MKSFFKDYGALWGHGWQFWKKHWLGSIIFSVVIWIIEIAILWPEMLVDGWNYIMEFFDKPRKWFKERREAKKFRKELFHNLARVISNLEEPIEDDE